MRISDWSSDVCSSDLLVLVLEIFDYEPELELHLRLQREVRRRGFVTSLELEPVGGAAAIEADGQQHERGVARDVRGDRQSVGEGKSVAVRGDLGGRSVIKNNRVISNVMSTDVT